MAPDSTIETGSASASFADNITFTRDPKGPSVVAISMNLDFGGVIDAGSGTPFGSGGSVYNFSVAIGSTGYIGRGSFDTLLGLQVTPSGLGDSIGAVLPGPTGFFIDLVTPSLTLDFGTLTSITLPVSLGVAVITVASGEGGSATANFGNTLEFARGRPVFDLPEGFTANAGDYLVNNVFGEAPPPPPSPDPSVIPLPASALLLLAGLGGLGLLRCRG